MGIIPSKTIEALRSTIHNSNIDSIKGSQQYICGENNAIQDDYEFINCNCTDDCWCKKNGCTGHYKIKEMDFNQFLNTYARLWIPPNFRNNVKESVLYDKPFDGRQKKAIPHLQWLMRDWDYTLNRARGHNKSGLCDDGVPTGILTENLYQSKMWSQLFYDSVVPFDTESRKKIIRAGYADPEKDFRKMNKELFTDLKRVASKNSMTVLDIRKLDKPSRVSQKLIPNKNGQPFSRILDKLFYSPRI